MADAKMLKKVPVREQDPKVRATNFEEVCLGYNQEEAMEEAQRCLGCKKPKCVEGCPVSINIPGFIEHIKEGNMEEAYKVIGLSSALPAICGRVCPQESQCEGQCIRGKKGEAVSIGKLERFVADYALEHDIKPAGAEVHTERCPEPPPWQPSSPKLQSADGVPHHLRRTHRDGWSYRTDVQQL